MQPTRTQQRTAQVSHWLYPTERAAEITVWPLSDGATLHEELMGRLSVSIDCGVASVSLRPTAAEARAIIEALQWALASEEDRATVCDTCSGTGRYRAPYGREATACPDCLASRISDANAATVASL